MSTLSRIFSKLRDVKINIKQDGFARTFKNLEQEWLPSNKTALTVIWIIVSIMAGELIIYKHQNLFSSYVTNASDFESVNERPFCPQGSREKYDTSVNSTSKLYQNILTRYASEEQNKTTVSKEVKKIAASNEPAQINVRAEISEPAAVSSLKPGESKKASLKPAVSSNDGRVIIHRVKQGETLAHISKKYYKTTSRFKQIAVQNNLKSPYSVKSGDKLIIVLR